MQAKVPIADLSVLLNLAVASPKKTLDSITGKRSGPEASAFSYTCAQADRR
jgi:hypothetical protein